MGRSHDLARGASSLYQTQGASDTRYVNTAGDTMTGNLQSTELVANNAGNNTNIRVQNTASGSGSSDGFLIQNATNSKVYLWNYENADVLFGTNGTERMKIDGSGRVTVPGQVSFKAHGQDNAYITTSPLGFPSLSGRGAHNIGNHYNTANSTFTAPVAGRYLFHVHIGIVRMTSTGGYIYPNLEVNSASIMYTYNNQSFSNSGSWNQYANSHMTQIVSLAANDVVRVTVQWGSADYYNGPGELSFAGCLLG